MMRFPRAGWDGEGSWHFPFNPNPTAEWYLNTTRLLLDWNDPYAPRRLYFYGKWIDVTLALERDGKSQRYLWLRGGWDRKLKRGRWLSIEPGRRLRERARARR